MLHEVLEGLQEALLEKAEPWPSVACSFLPCTVFLAVCLWK